MKLKTILTSTLHTVSISTAVLVAMGLINPTFSAPPSRASVSVTVEGAGTVTSNPDGISCPTDCTQQYKTNTLVTFFATNNNESTFSGWGGACIEFGTASTCNVQVSGSVSITAQFTPAIRYPAPVPATGQTNCYDSVGTQIDCAGTGQDGDVQAGVSWPIPRFTDNSNGTVTDNLTGLIWLKNANCIANNIGFDNYRTINDGRVTWQQAFDFVVGINNGTYNCDDTSNNGSHQTDWRLPNIRELTSLIHPDFHDPSIPNTVGNEKWTEGNPFTSVQSNGSYWSSTTMPIRKNYAWVIYNVEGQTGTGDKRDSDEYVWPVRGGLVQP